MVIKFYFSSITSNLGIKKHQQRIEMILSSKKYEYESIDIAHDETAKERMRELMGDPKGLPPQLCNDDTYLGGFEEFQDAVDDEKLEAFLKI
ncbi:SH3 domain-binding glutamic acid-rich-like protein 3 [Acanthaster planci]|uniref:SH3 domain-binding glutamic acid-rich-like protein 3 n=1 Tax=Acanthaster planci TaxID=133434 RepID=A0A8B7XPE8_ACAPL|nr:SH3 domain-binding glutamic acid-rich-like protein 3 [Acanthaster planci]